MSLATTVRPTLRPPGPPPAGALDGALRQGLHLFRQGLPEHALPLLLQVLEIKPKLAAQWPGYPVALATAAIALHQCGRHVEALEWQSRLLLQAPGNDEAAANFLLLLRAAGPALPAGQEFRSALLETLKRRDLAEYAINVAWALLADEAFRRSLEAVLLASDTEALAALTERRLGPLLGAPLLLLALRQTVLPLPRFEALFAKLRRLFLLAHAQPAWRPGKSERLFLGTLAHYVWLTEYALAESPAETALLVPLQALAAAPPVAAQPAPAGLAILALYRNWSCDAEAWLDLPPTAWDAGLQPLLQEWRGQRQERRLAEEIVALTPIGSGVSSEVRRQYEENPFPRWKQRLAGERRPAAAWLPALCPALRPGPGFAAPIDVLVAGCGTGLEAISLARQVATRRLLAIDLSRASLAYAVAMARQHGVADDIEFRQADLMQLGDQSDRFDLITSSGVLHHLAEPLAGWRLLAERLRPGGIMLVSLYSEAARRPVVEARRLIAERGSRPEPAAMRALRAEILAGHRPELTGLTDWRDFYSLSMFRDLVFHAHEERFTLPRIKDCLQQLGLRFVAMQSPGDMAMQAYRARFPDDPLGTDLDHWAAFEAEHPNTFAAMYRLVLEKPAADTSSVFSPTGSP
jgi:2-polyprenyl-3-methyl-5-hydroxy-6-metoxy-1,4-benzoquinol methylase